MEMKDNGNIISTIDIGLSLEFGLVVVHKVSYGRPSRNEIGDYR